MQSVLNNYLLLETSLNSRLTSEFDWTVAPTGSSTAAYLLRPESLDKTERMYKGKGKATKANLSDQHFQELLQIWRHHNADFGALMSRFEREQRDCKGKQRGSRRVTSLADWNPRKDPLTNKERKWTSMKPRVEVHNLNDV